MKFMKHFARVPSSNKIVEKKFVRIVPKPLIGQTASEFLRLYPSANILVATERDFEKSRRKQFVSRIATGDYDCSANVSSRACVIIVNVFVNLFDDKGRH